MKRIVCIGPVALLLFVGSCVTVESTFKSDGLKNAAFDLQCPEDQVEMTVLTRNDGLGCAGSKIGVRGCGKQTTYECDDARTWHRSAEVSQLDAPAG